MKTTVTIFVATSVLLSLAAPTSASAHRKRHAKHGHHNSYPTRYVQYSYGYVPRRQIEYDTRALPLGTGIWWQQYDRERGGRGR